VSEADYRRNLVAHNTAVRELLDATTERVRAFIAQRKYRLDLYPLDYLRELIADCEQFERSVAPPPEEADGDYRRVQSRVGGRDAVRSDGRSSDSAQVAVAPPWQPIEEPKCEICREHGIAPSRAIACALHSTYAIRELRAEIMVLKDAAGASSRLHLALADLDGSVPSADGSQELASAKEARKRLERVRAAIERALAIANYDDDAALPDPPAASAPQEKP